MVITGPGRDEADGWPARLRALVSYSPAGIPVMAAGQPALHELVAEVRRLLDHPPTTRVWLNADAQIRAEILGGGRYLFIGLPLLHCLDQAEVRALVAYQLALLQRPRPRRTMRMLARWQDALLEPSFEDGQVLRRAVAMRARLGGPAAELEQELTGAAIRAAGGVEPAARAAALAQVVEMEYDTFLAGLDLPASAFKPYVAGIVDLDDGWRRAVRHGLGETDWCADEAALLAATHPLLADALTALGRTPLPVLPAPDPVAVAPLTVREQRRIVRGLHVPNQITRWYTFETVPPARWRRRAAKGARAVRAEVAAVLGRDPVDDLETIRVLQTRAREVVGTSFDVPIDEVPEFDSTAQPGDSAGWLIEDQLLRRGWRLEHPAVRGILVGPDGARIDGYQVLREGPDSPALRRVFAAGA